LESIQKTLQDSSSYILPVDALLQTLPHLTVDEQQAKRLEMGQRVPLNLPSIEALVRIYRATAAPHNFIGTADWRSGVLHPKRLISQAH
jgi:tRNA pseudouridine55 synthase